MRLSWPACLHAIAMFLSAGLRDTYSSLLNLMSDTSGSEMVYLQFGEEVLPMQLLIAKQWSKVLATATEAGQEGPGCRMHKGKKIVIPMDCRKQDWLTVIAFGYATIPRPTINWSNLQVFLEIGDKYNMPVILNMCSNFLLDHMAELDSSGSSQRFGWKWIGLADKADLVDHHGKQVAKTCFDAKSTDLAFCRSCNKDLVSSLSPDLWQHILITFAGRQCGVKQAHCGNCYKVTTWERIVETNQLTKVNSSRVICQTCRYPFGGY